MDPFPYKAELIVVLLKPLSSPYFRARSLLCSNTNLHHYTTAIIRKQSKTLLMNHLDLDGQFSHVPTG
jgi:hypothetical protein